MANVTLTTKEQEMLTAFIEAGIAINGAETAEWMIEDNMTVCNADDLLEALGGTKQSIGGTMSALEAKNLIQDLELSYRGARCNDWICTDFGIEQHFQTN
tara:strand:+ start:2548 stop:2847 length:300 start_codon:yes stop_codon:yes gene_type:complete